MTTYLDEDLKFLQNTMDEDNNMFNRIRDSIKKTGDMFLLGKPSEQILNLILKLYHENIIRLLLQKDNEETKDLKMMLGLMELNDGSIYITLSEDPREDPNFTKKTKMLYSLLKQCNVNVLYPERDLLQDENKSRIPDVNRSNLFPDVMYSWRSSGPIITAGRLKNNAELMFIDEEAMVKGPTATYNYDDSIWAPKMDVNLIHSIQYLNDRKAGTSFVPFKKVKRAANGDTNYECNNGSTCSESKLFSYLFTNLGLNFTDIKGYAAYWISNNLPPNHIIAGYSFSNSIAEENKRLEELTDQTLPLLNSELYSDLLETYLNKFRNVFKSVVQPFALPCPGCFANYLAYKTNRKERWDNSQCLPYSSRTRQTRTLNSGGKKITKKYKKKIYKKYKRKTIRKSKHRSHKHLRRNY